MLHASQSSLIMNGPSANLRLQVLTLYRRILNLANQWPQYSKANNENAIAESHYIRNEARFLFRQNAHLKDEMEIMHHIREGESRIDLAMHYGTPYPRLINVPAKTLAAKKSSTSGVHLSKRTGRALRNSMPSYLKSYQDKPKNSKQ